jgi:hypothetical protein
MYKNVAGVMHMGEMKFKQRPREEQAEVDTEDGNDELAFVVVMTDSFKFRRQECGILLWYRT